MKPSTHLILGFLISILLFLFDFSLFEISVFFLSSFFLIDLDHVPRFVLKEKSLNPIKFLRDHNSKKSKWTKLSLEQRKAYKKPVFFFHNIETLLILLIISIFLPIFFFVFFGFVFHLVCDLIYQHYHSYEKHYKLCLIYTLIKNNKKEFL